MPGTTSDVLIGGRPFRVIEGPLLQQLGFPGLDENWQSLFPDATVLPGAPNFEKLHPEDLRWVLDQFEGGSGQKVFRQGVDGADSRFFFSRGVDLSDPGTIRLNRAMFPRGYTGGAVTTVEGSAFTVVSGSATNSGTDKLLALTNTIIETDFGVLAAGVYQARWYAYVQAATRTEGNALGFSGAAKSVITGTDRTLQWNGNGGYLSVGFHSVTAGKTNVTFRLEALGDVNLAAVHISIKLLVCQDTESNIVAEKDVGLTFKDVDKGFQTWTVSFTAKAGKQYKYRVQLESASWIDQGVQVDNIEEEAAPSVAQNLTCAVYDGGADVVSKVVDVSAVKTAGQIVHSATFLADGVKHYYGRFRVGAGNTRQILADKIDRQLSAMNDAYHLDLGMDAKIWLVDRDPLDVAVSKVFYWDASTPKWLSIGTVGVAGAGNDRCVAMDGSDLREYLLMEDRKVYYVTKTVAAATQYSAQFHDKAVGMAVAADRLYVLVENATPDGTDLYELALDASAGLPLAVPAAPVGSASTLGVTPNPNEIGRRMCAIAGGVVFFTNRGHRCTLSTYNIVNGTPTFTQEYVDMPDGFEGRAIAHGMGTTWIGGQFPAVDSTGTTRPVPAVFRVDHLSNSIGSFTDPGLVLSLDTDPDSELRDIQVYADNVWILTEVKSTPKKLRLWRMSLRSPGGLFCEQELNLGDGQTGIGRAIALNWKTQAVAFTNGAPFVASDEYITDGSAYLESSSYAFGLFEDKVLYRVDLDGDFPTGTSAEIWLALDGGAFSTVGTFTESGSQSLEAFGASPIASTIQVRIVPKSSSSTATPLIRSASLVAGLGEDLKTTSLALLLSQPTTGNQAGGNLLPPIDDWEYLQGLRRSKQLVVLEDFTLSRDRSRSHKLIGSVDNLRRINLSTGEYVARIRFTDRSA